MSFEILATTKCKTHVLPGDRIQLYRVTDVGHQKLILEKRIEETADFDGAVIFRFTDEMGFKEGIGGAFVKG